MKPNAFLPPKDLRLSVFLTQSLSSEQIWILGKRYLGANVYGRAELTLATVSEIGLKVDIDNRPQRHANIIGWPTQKSERKLYAIKLAEKSSLVLRSVQIG